MSSDSDHAKTAMRREKNAKAAAKSRERKRLYAESVTERLRVTALERDACRKHLAVVMDILKDREQQLAKATNGVFVPKPIPALELPLPRAWSPMENPFVNSPNKADADWMDQGESEDSDRAPIKHVKRDPDAEKRRIEQAQALLEKYRLPIEGLGLEGWKHAVKQAEEEAEGAEPDWEASFHSLLDHHQKTRRNLEQDIASLKLIIQGIDSKDDFYRKELEKADRAHYATLQKEREAMRAWKEGVAKSMADLREFYVAAKKGEANIPIPAYSPAEHVVPLPPNLTSLPHHVVVRLLQQTHLHLSAAMDDLSFLRKEITDIRTGAAAESIVKHGLANPPHPPAI